MCKPTNRCLAHTQLRGANLKYAKVQGANLKGKILRGTDLWRAQMRGADLQGAQLQGADLRDAWMQGARLWHAQLQGANLVDAQLQGADMRSAQLQGADLRGADLRGADLRGAALWQAQFDEYSRFALADLRGIQVEPVSAVALTELLRWLEGAPEHWRQAAVNRITKALTRTLPPPSRPLFHIEAGTPVLVDSNRTAFADFGAGLTTEEAVYDAALATFLADLASSDAAVARSITQRTLETRSTYPEAERRLWPNLARRLLAAEKEGAFSLDLPPEHRKTLEDLAAKASPPPPRKDPAD